MIDFAYTATWRRVVMRLICMIVNYRVLSHGIRGNTVTSENVQFFIFDNMDIELIRFFILHPEMYSNSLN